MATQSTNSIQHITDGIFNSFNEIVNFFGFKLESVVKLFGGCAISFISYIIRIKPTILSAIAQYRFNIEILACKELSDFKIQSAAFANLLNQYPDVNEICIDRIKCSYSPAAIRNSFTKCLSEVRAQSKIFTSALYHQLKLFSLNCLSTTVS